MSELSEEQKAALLALAKEHNLLPDSQPIEGEARAQLKLPTADRELPDFADELGKIAAVTKLLYRRDQTPVTVNAKKKRLEPMTSECFRSWIAPYAACFKERKKAAGGSERKIFTMTVDVARGVLASPQFLAHLSEIERLNETRLPVRRRDGRIDLLPLGYFEEQHIYTIDDGLTYDETLPLEKAREILASYSKEFPFLNDRSKRASLAAQLTMFCASMIEKGKHRSPGFVYTANSPRAGKTLLAKLAIIVVTGSGATRSFPRYEEARKVLDSIVLEGASYALFDNVRGKIQGEDIESFITAPIWEARPLGQSALVRAENIATVFFTGNQSTHSTDIGERCLFIELFVEEADSRDRKFSRIIDDALLASSAVRSELCSALWSLVRAWDADGRPPPLAMLPGFEEWSKLVPAIIKCAGYGDAIERPDMKGAESEPADMRSLVAALAPPDDEAFKEYQFEELTAKLKELGLFDDADFLAGRRAADIYEEDGRVTRAGRSLFGKLFARYDRRLFHVAGVRLRFLVIGRGDSRHYRIESATQDAPTAD